MIDSLLKEHKEYFATNETKDLAFRKIQLGKLKKAILKHEFAILEALKLDLGKSHFEGYATEVGFVLDSIEYMSKHLKSWAKNKKVRTPIHQFYSKSLIRKEPYGTVLIISPFNYPFQLLMEPLVGAIAAGNTVILKPSRHTSNTEKIITKLISESFEKRYISVVSGNREIVTKLINSQFNYIFFTGSVSVGKIVMEAAAKNLIPVTLELGGKSPTIVHKDANLEIAAKRIAWGKFLNTGQTCVAPDYVYVHKEIKEKFKTILTEVINSFYLNNPSESVDYGNIVNEKEFNRLINLIDYTKVYYGGNHNIDTLHLDPTILDNVTWDDKIMSDEIFGPIMPLLTYENIDNVIDVINSKPIPLALYIFTKNKKLIEKIIHNTSSGGVSVNDTISHITNPRLPFGGKGTSGIGAYHGKFSFDTFTHSRSILIKSTKINIPLIFPPYKNKITLVKKILK